MKGDKGPAHDAASGSSGSAGFQETAGIRAAGSPGGECAEKESGQYGGQTSHGEDDRVRVDGNWSPFHRMSEEREQVAGSVPGRGRTQSGSGEGDDEALRKVLAHQPPARGADCGAKGELLPARVDLRHHQSRDIHAAQQEHDRYQALHQVEGR